jgi:hypothetical protein
MALEVIIIIYFFSPSIIFSFTSSLFLIREREQRNWFLNVKGLKCTNIWQQWRFTHCWNSMEHIRLGWQACKMPDYTHYECNENKNKKCDTANILRLFSSCTCILQLLLQPGMQLHLYCIKLLCANSLAAYHAYLIIFLWLGACNWLCMSALSNVKEQRKKIKIMQRQKKHYGFHRYYRHKVKKRKHLHRRAACSQLSHCGWHNGTRFNTAYKLIEKKPENKLCITKTQLSVGI